MQGIRKAYWVLRSQFGIDLKRTFTAIVGLPRYIRSGIEFASTYKGKLRLMPCLSDWNAEGGETKSEYFWQDLYIARKISESKPEAHVDVGSRIDGFVAHVASFREIEVFDIRPLSPSIPGVVFKQADFMSSSSVPQGYCDSLSCLHALEHFGLGRYGDPINPQGYVLGLQNFARILKKGGTLYLSVPVGRERVEFNAHRVFDPVSLVDLAFQNELVLRELAWVAADRSIHRSEDPSHDLQELGKSQYVLGMFTFSKD